MVIVDKAISTHQEKALTTAGIMNQFEAETPREEELSAVLYAVNILSSIIGYTLKGVPAPGGMSVAWNEASWPQKTAFLTAFRAMKDYLTKVRSELDHLFSTEENSSTLLANIGFVFDKLSKLIKPPTSGSQESV